MAFAAEQSIKLRMINFTLTHQHGWGDDHPLIFQSSGDGHGTWRIRSDIGVMGTIGNKGHKLP
jgi:hypothetical protein